ncbi:izumo sperm-egg fusion protein 1 isoform X2 [Poecile atricapillus]|nr:izumo sperm-egg fusion protein 1 isoform X2 [Poecile atricapillus]XP_058715724.1 izumo sperm-egg fusion protein 1 isoform X2 [Poecile atricapillus]
MAQDVQEQQIYQEMLWAMREIKEDFERIMKRFQSQVYCPNKCGRMEVLWIECIFCNLTHFACNRGMDCGERQLWVEEGQDLVLDCALPWHGASHGAKTYSFYRGLASAGGRPEPHRRPPHTRGAAAEEPPRPPPAERLLRSGPDPVLVWKEAAEAAGGRYRCQMRGPGGRVGSELLFNVTVLPRPRVPGQAPPRAPTPPGGAPPGRRGRDRRDDYRDSAGGCGHRLVLLPARGPPGPAGPLPNKGVVTPLVPRVIWGGVPRGSGGSRRGWREFEGGSCR